MGWTWGAPNSKAGSVMSSSKRAIVPMNDMDLDDTPPPVEISRSGSSGSIASSNDSVPRDDGISTTMGNNSSSTYGESAARRDYPPELLASEKDVDELGLPEALLAPLEEEEEVSGPMTVLQANVLGEGRMGAHLLVQEQSGAETTVAFSVLLLKQLLDRGLVSATIKPWEGCKDESNGEDKSNKGSEKSTGGGVAGFFSKRSSVDLRAGGSINKKAEEGEGQEMQLHAIVLARNKEIAAGITETIERLGQGIPGLELITLVGGVPVAENVRLLKKGCHIAVGTPGRVRYLIAKGALPLSTVRTLVLESADFLMAPVFQDDVGWVAGKLPESKQVLAFSTTDASAVRPALSALVGVPELKTVSNPSSNASVAAAAAAAAMASLSSRPGGANDKDAPATDGDGDAEGTVDAASGASENGDSPRSEKTIVRKHSGASADAVARAADVSAAAEKFLKLTRKIGEGGGKESALAAAAAAAESISRHSDETRSVSSSMSGTSSSSRQRPRSSIAKMLSPGAKGKGKAADTGGPKKGKIDEDEGEEGKNREKKDGVDLTVATGGSSSTSVTSAASETPSPPSLRLRAQRAARAAQAALANQLSTPRAPQAALASQRSTPTLAPCSPMPGGDSSGFSSDEATTNQNDSRTEDQSAVSRSEEATMDSDPAAASAVTGSASPSSPPMSAAAAEILGNSEVRDAAEDGVWPAGGSGGTGSDAGSSGKREGSAEQEDRTSLGLLSPGAVMKDSADGREEGGASGATLRSVAVVEAPAIDQTEEEAETEMVKRPMPSAEAVAKRESVATLSMSPVKLFGGAEQVVVREEDAAEYLEEQHQKQLDLMAATMDLLEGWNIPLVLLAALEADDFRVPTALQASVWSAGRGEYKADLLVHVQAGDETATAFAIPILERVWEMYPPPMEPRQKPVWDVEVQEEQAANAPVVEVQALVLTRTRDVAASVTETLLRLGRGIPNLTVATLIGGVPVAEQARALAGGCHVAVGTPGRVRFWMKKGVLHPHSAKTLVLDSADWLMAPVFQEDVGWIAGKFPMDKQVLAFSAAEPSAIEDGLRELVNSPHITSIGGSTVGESYAVGTNPDNANPISTVADVTQVEELAMTTGEEEERAEAEAEAAALLEEQMEALNAIQRDREAAAAAAAAAVAHAERELLAAEEDLRATIAQGEATIGGPVGEAAAEAAMAAVAGGGDRTRRSSHHSQLSEQDAAELALVRNNGFGAVRLTASGKAAANAQGLSPLRSRGPMGGMRVMTSGSGGGLPRVFIPPSPSTAVDAARTPLAGDGPAFKTRVRLSRENQLYGAWCRQSIAQGRR